MMVVEANLEELEVEEEVIIEEDENCLLSRLLLNSAKPFCMA